MSSECDKCGEDAVDCVCNEDLTSIPPMPESVQRWLLCNLLHNKAPVLTGKKIWNEHEKTWAHEIVYVCKEGCRNKLSLPTESVTSLKENV